MQLKKLTLFFLLICIAMACKNDDDDDASPDTGVYFQEVRYNDNDRVEIKNGTSSTMDISSWFLCSLLSYEQLSNLTVVEGSLNLEAGKTVILSGFELNDTQADLGLFQNNSFASSEAIVDFLQWGGSGNGRESVAAGAGIWTAGDFIQNVSTGNSIEYDGEGEASGDWAEQTTPTLGN